jgi:hypothetical protein
MGKIGFEAARAAIEVEAARGKCAMSAKTIRMGKRYGARRALSVCQYVLMLALVVSCSVNTPTPIAPTPTALPTVAATARPSATATLLPTATARPINTPQPSPTTVPTRAPNEAFWIDLQKYPAVIASTIGPRQDVYTAYLISQIAFCHLYFFHWDGYQNTLIGAFFSDSWCTATNWDLAKLGYQEHSTLGLSGYWSDINHNGLPELIVDQSDGCLNNCNDANGSQQIFEIQTTDRVVDIAADLPGKIEPTPGRILHSANPLTIYVHQYNFYELHNFTDVDRIVKWDGNTFVDVSAQYIDEYRQEAQNLAQAIGLRYGHPLDDGINTSRSSVAQMLTILALYNNFHLPAKEGLGLFLDVTKPSHWPGSDRAFVCWLQLARAYAQIDYSNGAPFRISAPNDVLPAVMNPTASWATQTALSRAGIDEKRFDVSACK